MRRLLLAGLLLAPGVTEAQTPIRVGWCARTLSSAAAPFAVATKMGWFAERGIAVTPVPMPGSTDCARPGTGSNRAM